MGTFVGTLAIAAIAPNFMGGDFNVDHRVADSKQNLHAIQLAVERYAVDHAGLYPATLQPLREEFYLAQFPRNPYLRRKRADGSDSPLQEAPLDQHAPGSVTFLPAVNPQSQQVSGYALLVYGNEAARKAMLRHHEDHHCDLPGDAEDKVAWEYVLLVLTSGTANPPFAQPPPQPPAPAGR